MGDITFDFDDSYVFNEKINYKTLKLSLRYTMKEINGIRMIKRRK